MAFIYALIDPRDGDLRYVGLTKSTIARRLREHCGRPRERSHRVHWIEALKRTGLRPIARCLQEVADEDAPEAERYWIKTLRERGCRLTNDTDGGDGAVGYRHTPEARARMSAARQGLRPPGFAGRKHSAETKAKMSKWTRRSPTDEEREAIASRLRGRTLSAEHRAKVAAAGVGRVATPEAREKMRVAAARRNADPAYRARLAAANAAANKSRVWTEEMRAKVADSLRRRRDGGS